jgi:hypothetical protein
MGLFDQLRKKPPPLPTASEREALALVDAIETTPHMSTILIALDQRLGADAAAIDGPERRFLETLRARLTTGRLKLPAIPEVMLRLDRALRDPDVGVRVVADAVRAEPVATLKLIGVANAATFAGLGRVSTVEGAIGRLGFAETKRVVLAAALASRLTRVAGWEEDIERTYQHSIATALANRAGWFEIDVTASVRSWVNGVGNNGWIWMPSPQNLGGSGDGSQMRACNAPRNVRAESCWISTARLRRFSTNS